MKKSIIVLAAVLVTAGFSAATLAAPVASASTPGVKLVVIAIIAILIG